MAASPELVAHCLELFAPLGAVRNRRMFGGQGFYVDELFVALIAYDRLFLKADAVTRPLFEAAGCEPFIYDSGAGKHVSVSYFSAPEDAKVVFAGHPDGAFEHREFTAEAPELQRLASRQTLCAVPIELRIHH